MDELNGHCSFTDAGGDMLDGAMPHISGGEDTGDADLQKNGSRSNGQPFGGCPDNIRHAVGLAA
jgi:hypothetical protein